MNTYRPRRIGVPSTSSGTKRLAVRLGASLMILAVLLALRAWVPSAGTAVGAFFDNALHGGPDYRAALSALGHVMSGEAQLVSVWNALSGAAEEVTTIGGASEMQGGTNGDAVATSTVTEAGKGGGYYAEKLDTSKRRSLIESALSGEDDYAETVSTYLTVEEDEEEEELSERICYDKIALDFDYQNPLNGVITSGFGYRIHPISGTRSFHYGIDIGAAEGEAITAFADGTIELVGYNSVYGNYLFIRHKDGILTFYGHCKKVTAGEGQLVRMGEKVATVGSTGWSTGPHLHFEVRSGESILDPSHYYQKQ